MKSFVVALFGVATASLAPETDEDFKFMQYIVKHNKSYQSLEEYNMRKANFLFMDVEIARLNAEQTDSVHGHNYLSDWTRQEYEGLLGLKDAGAPLPESERP